MSRSTMATIHSTNTSQAPAELAKFIRDIPDFPKPGILFRDITPLLASPIAFRAAIDMMALHYHGQRIDAVAAAEARGFIFAAPLAIELGIGFVPIRKRGKLPSRVHSLTYELEYGNDTVEMHVDALSPGHCVLLVDDLLATGGTMKACCELVEQTGATIAGCAFLVELAFLNGRDKLAPYGVFSLITYRD
jgi:adenine phosphoribosyltransferase